MSRSSSELDQEVQGPKAKRLKLYPEELQAVIAKAVNMALDALETEAAAAKQHFKQTDKGANATLLGATELYEKDVGFFNMAPEAAIGLYKAHMAAFSRPSASDLAKSSKTKKFPN